MVVANKTPLQRVVVVYYTIPDSTAVPHGVNGSLGVHGRNCVFCPRYMALAQSVWVGGRR